jgi:hypothetical protein
MVQDLQAKPEKRVGHHIVDYTLGKLWRRSWMTS